MSPHPTAAAPGFYRASGLVPWPGAVLAYLTGNAVIDPR